VSNHDSDYTDGKSNENSNGRFTNNLNCSLTVNLSSTALSKVDIELLDKGLSFIPTLRSLPINKIYEAQNRLIRNLKLKDYFAGRQDSGYDPTRKKFTNPSSWTPPDHKISPSTLGTIREIVARTEATISQRKVYKNQYLVLNSAKSNLTSLEKQSLETLKRNDSIIIKPADKGGATVIMNKDSYINEALRQLNNQDYYVKLDRPIFQNNIPKLNCILSQMKSSGLIDANQLKFLQAKESDRSRIFYLLPKIHKPRTKWPQSDMPEGRPIVSDCGSESYRISQYIDSVIRPISTKHPSYIKDTYDFVNKIRGFKIPSNAFLITGDVSSLYTNMHFDRTLTVTRNALDKHCEGSPLNKYLLDLLEITLKNNDFTFNDNYYLQTCGTAMGKSYAPGLADLYLEEFDFRACNNFKIKPLLYFRFLDDIFLVMVAAESEIKEFENYLNSLIPGIKVTLNYSQQNIDFLDTTVYVNSDTLLTRVFFKETDTHQLLHKLSFHPKHTFKGVLKSQLLRFKRISSSYEDYDNTCKILFDSLTKRNYSKSLLRKMKRDIYFYHEERVAEDKTNILPIVVPYCELGCNLVTNWKASINKNNKFSDSKLISAYCNGKNLYKHLVSSALPVVYNNNNTAESNDSNRNSVNANADVTDVIISGSTRCKSNRCRACNYITVSKTFKSSSTNSKFWLRTNVSCKSNNIVYLITCKKCNKQYVGETGRTLGERITDHLSCIRTFKDTPIALHFNQTDHSLEDFSIMAIEKIQDTKDARTVRLLKETTWQTILQTAHPHGINNLNKNLL